MPNAAKNRSTLLSMAIVGVGLIIVATVTFSDFLFGNAVLLYKDIGSDSLRDYYPTFVHLSNYLRTDGIPGWSFHIGMGQDMAYATGFLIWQPITWLPQGWIAQGLVYQHLAKVVLAGLI